MRGLEDGDVGPFCRWDERVCQGTVPFRFWLVLLDRVGDIRVGKVTS